MRIALVGQPNCGKSTLFNQVAGYKAETGNFHGTTVTFTESKVRVSGEVIDLVDLPGTYTLGGTNRAEAETARYLKSEHVDLIINVVDATHLSQGLELTQEILQLERPMVIALNMMDEAKRTGLRINGPGLQERLGVPVLPLIASKGQGVMALFKQAVQTIKNQSNPTNINNPVSSDDIGRHEQAALLTREFVIQGERRMTWRDRIDDILLHPTWGYLAMAAILFLFFQIVYGIGSAIEGPILHAFTSWTDQLLAMVGSKSIWGELIFGLLQGISGGLAIALPYLVPFLLGLGLLEDIGYLPRIAFLMDGLMHRMGLHGKAIVPFILGYGCNVPAVMATRILEEKQDRFLAAALAVMVPCAARLAVVFGLVAFYLGPIWALAIYIFNILVIGLLGRILTSLLPEKTPGLILEMPVYRIPTFKTVFNKAWFRVREFLVEAWPLLIAGSIVLAVFTYFNISPIINLLVRPITWVVGLPSETGVPLIFGVLRKELSLIMLRQALGGLDFASILTPLQMLTFSVFVVFYIPCLPTLSCLRRELGTRRMLLIALLTVLVALATAIFVRVLGSLIL
ncbi:ferrous iron transporter B [Chloroflexota bacterium]